MKRALGMLPYLFGVIAMYLAYLGAIQLSVTCEQQATCGVFSSMNWSAMLGYLAFGWLPAIALVAAAILGYRRGLDWMTLGVCLVAGFLIPLIGHQFNATAWMSWLELHWMVLPIYAVVLPAGLGIGIGTSILVHGSLRQSVVHA